MTDDYVLRRDAARLLRARGDVIAEAVTDEFLRRHADWITRYGDRAKVRGIEDARFHVEFLAGAILADDDRAFEEYAVWTARVLSARGIAPSFLAENLEQVAEAAERELTEVAGAFVRRTVSAGIAALGRAPASPGPEGAPGGRFETERRLYVQAILEGNRRAALNVTLEALRVGATVADVYVEILQPAQYEVGRLWERSKITVAKEHMATAVTQYVVAQLYPRLEVPDTVRGNALITGVRGELHQLGANMVADVLESDGWNTRFLGTQLPHQDVLDAIGEHAPRLLGISATVLFNLPAVADLIEDVRRVHGTEVTILVGGGAFRANPDTWKELGADACGRDLRHAVELANQLLPSGE
ncbi:MAG: cobalamin-dependent protein [Gemmatimonadota bacterium]